MSQGKKNDSSNISQFNKFLNNNADFIKKKYDQHFQTQITLVELKQSKNIEKSLDFIYDIFNLHKYHNNPQLKDFLQASLTQNVINFVSQTIHNNSEREDQKFDAIISTELLRYCIQKNDIFAVNYDKNEEKTEKQQDNKVKQEKQQTKDKQNNPQQIQPVENAGPIQKENTEEVQSNLINEGPDDRTQKIQEGNTKPQKVQINSNKRSIGSFKNISQSVNYSQQDSQTYLKLTYQKDSEIIKKHLRLIFEFYCKQQQSVNPKSTFDSINHKCQTMNIGKFMTFAHASKILSDNDKEIKIDKMMIVSIFKKIAEGKREIDFHHFQAIIQNLSKKDENIFRKMGIVGSRSKAQILKRLKEIILPFNTRDQQPRQKIPIRQFVPKLTQHSGKIEQSLRQEIMLKKQKLYFDTLERNRQLSSNFTLRLGKIRQDGGNQLKFLSKLIRYDDNDKIFLKEYELQNKSQDCLYQPVVAPKNLNKRYSLVEQNDSFKSLQKKPPKYINKVKYQEHLTLPLIKKKDKNQAFFLNQSTIKKQKL